MRRLFYYFLISLATLSLLSAQELKNTWGFNGEVSVIKPYGEKIYIGGKFDYYGPITGSGALIREDDTTPSTNFPKVNGHINACVPDGSGGWYIGGSFTRVGDVDRENLAQINSDGTVSAWDPKANGEIIKIAAGNDAVFVSGYFSSVGGQPRNYVAKLNKSNGAAYTDWDPNPDQFVYAIALDGKYVYLGGSFRKICGTNKQFVAKVKASDASLVTEWRTIPNGVVRAIALQGNAVYLGGDFNSLYNIGVALYVAKVKSSDGTTGGNGWNPSPNDVVTDIAIDGNKIFLAGKFTEIGAEKKIHSQFLAVVGSDKGKPDLLWEAKPNNFIDDIEIYNGKLYVVGEFTQIGGQIANHVARLDEYYGLADTDWLPNANTTVKTIAFDGNRILLGGSFFSVGGKSVKNIVRLNKDDFTLDETWLPQPDNGINSIEVDKNSVFIAGSFNFVGNKESIFVAKLNKSTGTADAKWDCKTNGSVNCLASLGDTLLVSGSFTQIGGENRDRIAMLSKSDGHAFGWNPSISQGLLYGTIFTMGVKNGFVYAAGRFFNESRTTIINYFRRISLFDGSEDPNWQLTPNGTIKSLYIHRNDIFVGGDFTSIDGYDVPYLAKINLTNGSVYPNWQPYPNSLVSFVTCNNDYVYAVGSFRDVGMQPISSFARFDYNSGLVDAGWNFNLENTTTLGLDVYTIALMNEKVLIGGFFNRAAGKMVNDFSVFIDNSYYSRIPSPPAYFKVLPMDHSILLKWMANREKDLARYNIYATTDTSKGYNLIKSVFPPDTTFLITGLKNGTKYFFRITAVDLNGNESIAFGSGYAVPNIVSEGLIAYYPFTNGSVADSSGHDINGTPNSVQAVTDRFGNKNSAIYFNGQNSFINCGKDSSFNPDTAISVTGWLYIKSTEYSPGVILSKMGMNSGYSFYTEGRKLKSTINQVEQDSTAIPLDQWVFFAFTFSGKTKKIYINGELAFKQTNVFSVIVPSSQNLFLGHTEFAGGAEKYFKGTLDDIRIYNRSLQPAEIRKILNSESWGSFAPQPPSKLHCVSRNGNEITIGWKLEKNSNIKKYNIYYTKYIFPMFEFLDSVQSGDSIINIMGNFNSSKNISFKITAVDDKGRESKFSDTINVYPSVNLIAPNLLSPLNTARIPDTLSSIYFSWDAVNQADNYRIQVSNDSQFNSLMIDSLITNKHTEIGLKLPLPLKPFYWRMRAENSCEKGPWSKTIFVNLIISDVESANLPKKYFLMQNYPNPFGLSSNSGTAATTIKYGIASVKGNIAHTVILEVYDILGRKIATLVHSEKSPGVYSINFNASKLSSGIYFYKLRCGNFTRVKKMIIMK